MTLHSPAGERLDPAIEAVLALIEKDIAACRHLRGLPAAVVAVMRRAIEGIAVDLDDTLEGDVAL